MPPPRRGRGRGGGRGRGRGQERDVNDRSNGNDSSHDGPANGGDDRKADLERSFDFAKDEEEKERLRMELERIREEEEEEKLREAEEEERRAKEKLEAQQKDSANKNDRRMDEDAQKLLLTWVGRTDGVKNVKNAQKDLIKNAKSLLPDGGTTYSICENYDTYQKGGLFPLLHINEDNSTVKKFMNSGNFIDPEALGPRNVVDQGVFVEVATITPPMTGPGASVTVIAVSAFKAIDPNPNPTLVKEWKQWTGARAFLQDIMSVGLACHKIKFLVKIAPPPDEDDEEAGGFHYVLITEVGIREPSDEGLFVDTLQRFRVERWFGYNTIYRKAK